MASESFKSDLRSSSRDQHRALTQKAKWAHGAALHSRGRQPESHPRPIRPSDYSISHGRSAARVGGSALKAASANRHDMVAAQAEFPALVKKLPKLGSSPSSTGGESSDDEAVYQEVEEDVVVGASAEHGPASGSQVLTGALAKAIEIFEDRETTKLVKAEWSVLDDDGEEVGLSPVKKHTGKAVVEEDDYEMI